MKILMKFLTVSICISIFFILPVDAFADSTYLEIVEVHNDRVNVYVTCRQIGNISNNLTLVCEDNYKNVVYINEYSAPSYGMFELTFPLADYTVTTPYTVTIGGKDFTSPVSRVIYLSDTTPPKYLYITPNQTVADLKNELKNNNSIFERNSVTLDNNTVVNSLDVVTLSWVTDNELIETELKTLILGDIDLNGKVTADDALTILQASVGKVTLSGDKLQAALTSRNDSLSSVDALYALQFAVNKISRL